MATATIAQPSMQTEPPTSALKQLRVLATGVTARAKGHVLGTWHELDDAREVAYCRVCWRNAVVDTVREPHLSGLAFAEPCAAPPIRPDAFLANQHESVTRGEL